MRTFDSALESSNMIFFDFGYRLGTIQMTYVHMKYVENPNFHKILMRFYGTHCTQNGTQKFRNFYHPKLEILNFPKPCRMPSYNP